MRLIQLITVWMEGINFGDTFHEDIRRLAPSHLVQVQANRSRLEEYWSLDGVPEIRLGGDEEYREAFLEVYSAAVRCRLPTDRRVGIFLSSGLDSGSVAALAAPELAQQNERLIAFTSIPAHTPTAFGEAGDEGPWVKSTARFIGNVDVHCIRAEEITPLEATLKVLEILQQPAHAASNFYWYLSILKEARDRNVGVMLTGQMGNFTVSWSGYREYVRTLLQTGQLARYWHELRAWKVRHGATLFETARNHILRSALPTSVVGLINRIRTRETGSLLLLNPDLAERLALRQQMRSTGYDPGRARSDPVFLRKRMLMHSQPPATQFELGAAHGLEIRDPTADRRILEFCLGVPDHQFHGDGGDRLLVRRGFSGLLPEEVLRNSRRGVQAADLGARLVMDVPALRRILVDLQESRCAAELLDLARMTRLVERIGISPNRSRLTLNALLKGIMVGVFLSRFARVGGDV